MRKQKQFTLRLSNTPGVLSGLASALWEKGINIRAFRAEVEGDRATIHMIVDKPGATRRVMVERRLRATEQDVSSLVPTDRYSVR